MRGKRRCVEIDVRNVGISMICGIFDSPVLPGRVTSDVVSGLRVWPKALELATLLSFQTVGQQRQKFINAKTTIRIIDRTRPENEAMKKFDAMIIWPV